jgi:hypothetical protein
VALRGGNILGDINWVAALLAALAFFALGAVWYSALFSKPWQAAVGMTDEQIAAAKAKGGAHMAKIMGLSFLLELVVACVLGHMIARSAPSTYGIMMMAVGLGAGVMSPAIGINYLYQNKPFKLFAIDAGYFIVGTAAMGGVFVAFD